MRPCPATLTSNLEGWRVLGCTQGWGRLAAPPRAGPQASRRGQCPSQATCGRGTPALREDAGAGLPSLLQRTSSCEALPLPAPGRPEGRPQAAADPPSRPRTVCGVPAEGARGPGQWAAPPGTGRSGQVRAVSTLTSKNAPRQPRGIPARPRPGSHPTFQSETGRLAGSRKEDGVVPAGAIQG